MQRRPLSQERITRWIPEKAAVPPTPQQPTDLQILVTATTDQAATLEPDSANVSVSVVGPSVVTAVTATDIASVRAEEQVPTAMSEGQLRQAAEEACRSRDNATACRMFDELAKRGDMEKYNHVSKLKHGISLRHLADSTDDEQTRIQLFERAADLLDQAAGHAIASYSAQALYEQSKALWRLWRAKHESGLLEAAQSAANRAALMVYDQSYLSWFERIKAEVDDRRLSASARDDGTPLA